MKTVAIKPYACSIIDIFEDFLDDKGVDIPNEEKEGEETEANIYGEDFDILMEDITGILAEICEDNKLEYDTESWTGFSDNLDDNVCCIDEITGTLGNWFEREFDADIPMEAREHLFKAYEICTKELEK